MILSDHSIREALAAGRIRIEPFDESLIQPASVDVRLDRFFRVFLNHTMPVIDVKQNLEELTELVEIDDDHPFVLHPGEFVLGATLERVSVPDDLVARVEGKALGLDTEVPTPQGWRTMEDLEVGDEVFGLDGRPVRVVAATDVLEGRPCYEVDFSDGSTVLADAQHQWLTLTASERRHGKPGSVRTTEEIAASLWRTRDRECAHRVPIAAPVELPERALPIDPYVLGAWLGDGTSTAAQITSFDEPILHEIERAGYAVAPASGRLAYRIGGTGQTRDVGTGRYCRNGSLSSTLRNEGLLGNKHIPEEYMQASVAQRQALLEGLMDTDGYVDRWGRCEFTTVRRSLAIQVRELVASLGFRPVIAEKRAMLNGVDHGPKFDVTFTPHRPVFRLPRKLARQKTEGTFERYRSIVGVRRVESVPVRCIQVSDPSGIFLVTRSFIPTHNSSLGRLGLLIHSSLPASEPLLVRDDQGVRLRSIGEIVKDQTPCEVVSFDPDTFEVGYHAVTGYHEGPADRIYEVRLASGRRVRVTAGHNLFTVDRDGELRKVRTAELHEGVRVAVPRGIPEPPDPAAVVDVLSHVPESEWARTLVEGPSVETAFRSHAPLLHDLLVAAGLTPGHHRANGRLPLTLAAQVPGLLGQLGPADRLRGRGERHRLPLTIEVDADLAWLLGMYVAEGYRRDNQVVVSNTVSAVLDRLERAFGKLGLPVHRGPGAVTCCSRLASRLFAWLEMGGHAPTKRVPPMVFGWPTPLVGAFLEGLVEGDGSTSGGRTSVWTTSEGLVGDALLIFARLGMRAAATCKATEHLPLWQVHAPHREHKLLTAVPLPDELLRAIRCEAGLTQAAAAKAAGYAHTTDLNNLERRSGRDAVRFATIRRLASAYAAAGADTSMLDRLADGHLSWDRVVEVVDTGRSERIYDIEVRPGGRKIENFLAGHGGVFVSNTAGFVDAGFDGHITLELSNVANLPITLYPGMKIGQVSFVQMTTPADVPYGSDSLKSKYQGQRGPTPSRYWENFDKE